MTRWLGVVAGVLLIVLALYLILFTSDEDQETSAGAVESQAPGTGGGEASAPAGPTPTAPPASSQPLFTVTTIEGLSIETVPPIPVDEPDWAPEGGLVIYPVDATDCDPTERGFGVEMRAWGQIRMPYAAGWPTNEPGQAPNCAPDTAFGAAVSAAQALWIETLQPELIPTISEATPAQRLRLDTHPGPMAATEVAWICESVGWSQASFRTFRIYSRCGDGPLKATTVTVTRSGDRWLLLYPPGGDFETREAEPGEAYYPFVEGD